MSDKAFWTLILLICIIIVLIVIYVCARLVIYRWKARKFYEAAEDLHNRAFTEKQVQLRRIARERYESLVEEAIRSKNPHINNRKMAVDLIEFAKFVVKMIEMDGASDAKEARSWFEIIEEKLEPLIDQGKNN